HFYHLPWTTPPLFTELLKSDKPRFPLHKITHLYRTFYSFSQTGALSAADHLPHLPSLRCIVLGAAGYDSVPIPYCKSQGIQVSNTPDVTVSATAETTLYLILAATRKFVAAERVL